jgi:hypothetical protein
MRSARWIWARPRTRFALLAVASACDSSGGGSCDPQANGALNQGRFAYMCPAHDPSEPGPDAFCDSADASMAIPEVAVGSSFALSVDTSSAGQPRPAVAALAVPSGSGWSLPQPGWVGFIAWSGDDVFDFTHVHGRAIATVALEPDPTTMALRVGAEPVSVAVVPRADDGTVLAGAIQCTFAVSPPSVVSVTGSGGRGASLRALAGGEASLTATCQGVVVQATVHVSAPHEDATPAEDAARDATDDQTSAAEDGAASEGGADGNEPGSPGDAGGV